MDSPELDALTRDPEDRHVCALAIAGRAQYLFTHDRGYLRDALLQHGIEVARPDDLLVATLEEQPEAMIELLHAQARTWAGGRPVIELLDAIERAGAAGSRPACAASSPSRATATEVPKPCHEPCHKPAESSLTQPHPRSQTPCKSGGSSAPQGLS